PVTTATLLSRLMSIIVWDAASAVLEKWATASRCSIEDRLGIDARARSRVYVARFDEHSSIRVRQLDCPLTRGNVGKRHVASAAFSAVMSRPAALQTCGQVNEGVLQSFGKPSIERESSARSR